MNGPTGREDAPLTGLSVAFTSRLASMSRADAATLVRRYGGDFARSVTRTTRILVVGAAGAPLEADGRPTRKLARAEALARRGFEIEVLREDAFLARIGVSRGDVLGRHPLPALAALLDAPLRTIASLVRSGLVAPAEIRDGVPLFDYQAVADARTLASLLASGVSQRRLLRSLARVKAWLPSEAAAEAVARLGVVDGRIVLRDSNGRWVEPDGQLVFGFEGIEEAAPAVLTLRPPSEDLFVRALDYEARGDLAAAADLYRQLLVEEGPEADAAFNLGNVLYAMGEPAAAAERFRQSAELDPRRADAWFNLGNILADAGETKAAIEAFSRAVAAESNYAEARSALADVLEQAGRSDEARPHWRVYLELEPHGPWADYALRRLAERPAS
jgi:tetratricopeptide (TPR) repeat protein